MEGISCELQFLGTGHATVTECYNTCFVLRAGADRLLVDAGGGNGILRQFRRAGLSFGDLTAVMVTHAHTDHILGVLWVIRMICVHALTRGALRIPIYGNAKCIGLLQTLCAATLSPKYNAAAARSIVFRTVGDGDCVAVGAHLNLRFLDLHSRNEPQLGFEAGFSGGRRLVCVGDEPVPEHLYDRIRGADWLLCEAFCLESESHIFHPHEKWHSTVLESARTAERLKVGHLLLYHTEDTHLSERKRLYTAEAREGFHATICVPDDLETVALVGAG